MPRASWKPRGPPSRSSSSVTGATSSTGSSASSQRTWWKTSLGDVIVRAIQSAFSGESVGQFRAWLNTITDRALADFYRARERGPEPGPHEPGGEEGMTIEPPAPDTRGYVEVQRVADRVEGSALARGEAHLGPPGGGRLGWSLARAPLGRSLQEAVLGDVGRSVKSSCARADRETGRARPCRLPPRPA